MAEPHREAAHLPKFNFPPDKKKVKILEIVEEIRHCDINQEIDVPELILCGQQSSGKSSVLEALTGLEFPKGDGGPCTRFPIEIRLFPGANTSYIRSKVRFRPPPTHMPSEEDAFQYRDELIETSSVNPSTSDIIDRAKEIMGISETNKFSHHVLSIEYHFPDPASPTHAPRLTLIDLPGLVAVEEGEFLERYTKKYIERGLALVLAVADGATDPENLRILKVVKESHCADRTFGIITKPDMMYPGAQSEARWVSQVIDPDPKQFGLGSHVLCNRSPSELQVGAYHRSLDDRNKQEEEFFAKRHRFPPNSKDDGNNRKLLSGWHEIYTIQPSDRWGIQNLRNRLVALLSDMASKQVLPIYRGVQESLKRKTDELAELDNKDPHRLKTKLIQGVYQIRKLAVQASFGSYKEQFSTGSSMNKPFFIISQESCRWLRSRIDEKSKQFSKRMRVEGHNSDEYVWKPDEAHTTDPKSKDVDQMLDLLHRTQSGTLPSESSHDVLDLVFKSFSEPWNRIASDYIDECHASLEDFVRDLVHHVLDNQYLAERLLAKDIMVKLENRKESAQATLCLIEQDREDGPFSLHPDMWMASRDNTVRLARSLKREFGREADGTEHELGAQARVEFDELNIVGRMTALKQLQNILLVYKKCRDTYIDNTVVQVVQRCLIRGFDDLFTHDWIYDEPLFDEITKDPNDLVNAEKRDKLREHIHTLGLAQKGLEELLGLYNSA